MKSTFAVVVVTVAVVNLLFFAAPSLFVMFLDDISIPSMMDRGVPWYLAFWFHRSSVVSAFFVAIATIGLLARRPFANVIAAIVLVGLAAQAIYTAWYFPAEGETGPLQRAPYNDEEFGRQLEATGDYVMVTLECLLIGTLLWSKRIRKAYAGK